jgi:uncharacterized pyridoxamine 5'-phosphate oxidase family protein
MIEIQRAVNIRTRLATAATKTFYRQISNNPDVARQIQYTSSIIMLALRYGEKSARS